ncbi:hypothetical protein PMAYCL1PPCAC_07975, partial [Pristionchus mayeri]
LPSLPLLSPSLLPPSVLAPLLYPMGGVANFCKTLLLVYFAVLGLFFSLVAGLIIYASLHENPYTTEKLIKAEGYPFEEHTVVTTDGYVNRIHRIPAKGTAKEVVLVQPGLLMDSACFVSNGAKGSLAFLLSDAGHDVWLGNARGGHYSEHKEWNKWEGRFWNFSWEDLAAHEIPSIIDFILKETGRKKLIYVGNSQSGLVAMALLSTKDEYNDKVKALFGLAPAASLAHVKGPMVELAPAGHLVDMLEDLAGPQPVLARSILNDVLRTVCSVGALQYGCERLFFRNGGDWSTQLDYSRLPIYYSNYPSGSSTKNTRHFTQMITKKRTARFDYGEVENLKRYGTLYPPSFNFSSVRVPMYLWYSDGDYLVGAEDITGGLVPQLKEEHLREVTHLSGYNHFDFHWGLRAPEDIFRPIVKFIDGLDAEDGKKKTKRVSRETFCAADDPNDICG